LVSVVVTLNSLNIKLGEGEDLGELSVFEVFLTPELLAGNVDDVATLVNQVAFLVDSAAEVINQPLLGVLVDDAAVSVFVELAHNFFNVEALGLVVEEFRQVTFPGELALIEFLATVHVNQVALASKGHPADLVDAAGLLVHEHALVGLHELGLAVLVIKVTHKLVRVEIVLFNAEGCWEFAALVHLFVGEHLLSIQVLNDGLVVGVEQVALVVGEGSVLVIVHAIVISRGYNDISFVVVVQIAQDVVNVEGSELSIWRHIDKLLSFELFKQGLSHLHRLVHLAEVVLAWRGLLNTLHNTFLLFSNEGLSHIFDH